MNYRNNKNQKLSKKEKDVVEEGLICGIEMNKRWFCIKDVLDYCLELQNEGYLGYFGIPMERLIPYLRSLIE